MKKFKEIEGNQVDYFNKFKLKDFFFLRGSKKTLN